MWDSTLTAAGGALPARDGRRVLASANRTRGPGAGVGLRSVSLSGARVTPMRIQAPSRVET